MSKLKKNLVYQTVYQMLNIVLPLITAPYIARVLGADNSGIYSFCNTMATYFVVFGNLGIEQYGNRCIAQARNNQDEMNEIFSELLIIHLITSVVSIIGYGVYVFNFVDNYKEIAIIEGLYVLSVFFNVNWFFFGIEKFKITVIRSSCIKILSVVLIFILVKSKNDLPIYATIMASSSLLSEISLWSLIKKYVKIRRIKFKKLKRHILPLLLLFIAIISANLNRVIDKSMLGMFGYIDDLGCYDYADKIIRIPLAFIAAIGNVMLPRMSNLYINNESAKVHDILNTSAHIVLIFSVAFGFGLAAISPEFIIFYLGNEYAEAIFLTQILAISIPFVGWNNFARTQILIPTQNDKIYTKAIIMGAFINIVINIFLIKQYSAKGAAIATIVSYIVITVIQTIGIKSEMELKRILKFIPLPLLAGVIMYAIVRGVSHININIIFKIFIEVIVGATIYMAIIGIYLFKRDKSIFKVLK